MKNHSPQNLPVNSISQALFFSFFSNHFLKLIAVFCLVALASCNKVDVVAPVNSIADNQGFNLLIVNDDFNWTDSRSVTLNITPLQTDSDLSSTLYVRTEDNHELLHFNTTIWKAHQLKFDLPTEQNRVKITYGAIEKIIDVSNNSISFDFITPIPAQYE